MDIAKNQIYSIQFIHTHAHAVQTPRYKKTCLLRYIFYATYVDKHAVLMYMYLILLGCAGVTVLQWQHTEP